MKQTNQAIIIRMITVGVATLTSITIAALLIYILYLGIPNITPSLFEKEYTSDNVSLFSSMINTIIVTAVTLLITVPIGIGSAIYLTEYAKSDNKFVKIIRLTTETLSGIPSIVYGLFGFLFFVTTLKWQFSLLSGCCTLSIMILPVIMRTTEEALMEVPLSYREASYSLGAGKLRTVFSVVLPSANYGIINGIILSI
jgi:phosphate transport system permease protein